MAAPKDLTKINAILKEYTGHPVRLWSYGASLSQLDLRIERGAAGNFHLRFADVGSVILPNVHWKLEGRVKYADSENEIYVFTDEASGASIMSGLVSLEENVEPLYR